MTTKPIFAFNIFTGDFKAFPSVEKAVNTTKVSTATIYSLLKANRPNYNTGWMYSQQNRRVWLSVSDIRRIKTNSIAKYNRLFSGRYYLLNAKTIRYGLVRIK